MEQTRAGSPCLPERKESYSSSRDSGATRISKRNVLQGGFEAWKAAGLPTQVEEKKPWSLERQVRAIAGSMVILFTVLGVLVSPYFLGLTLFVGAGLLFAGVTDVCLMATALGKLPWNRASSAACNI